MSSPSLLKKRYGLRYTLISVWLLFTLSLATWWYIYSLRQLEKVEALNPTEAGELMRSQKMLTLEGLVLIICLLGGGGALTYLVIRDQQRQEKIVDFFLTFSHELKTPLSTVRLHAESLFDDLRATEHKSLASKLLDETSRLTVQLDNSLYLANLDNHKTFLQALEASDIVRQLEHEFPQLTIHCAEDFIIYADSAAMSTMMRNFARNAIVHGQATELHLSALKEHEPYIDIAITDNGRGFRGDPEKLGTPFLRHYDQSGNGIGLYLSRRLAELMGGFLRLKASENHFQIVLTLKGKQHALTATA